jgi:DsbC/DsbD-like thiol-disulfide interchange protein/cytochrome c biogenesis protein CcdA
MKIKWLFLFSSLLAVSSANARPEPHVRVDLVPAVTSIAAGDSFDVLFRQHIDDEWHTYWTNPGDSGAAPDIKWTASEGVSVSEFQYPHPERIPYGPLMNYGYHHEVLMPFSVSVPEDYSASVVELKGTGRVLVCADICIPEKVDVMMSIPIGETVLDDTVSDTFLVARAKVPVPIDVASSFQVDGDKILLTVGLPPVQGNRIEVVEYFPFTPDLIDNPATQPFSMSDEGLVLTLAPGYDFRSDSSDLSGVIVIHESVGEGIVSSFEFTMVDDGSPTGALIPGRDRVSDETGLLAALFFAFLGGLILNLMPCVFPVLSIKILSLVESHHDGGSVRLHGLAYAGGVIASFVVIALVLIGLRAGGEAIGWGFQLQSPIVVSMLAYLFLVIGLNLLGVFEIGGTLMSLGNGGGREQGYLGSVSTGVLATIVAAPCTAPFMGAAVGYALIQSPVTGVLVFASLGLGMALPYVLLCYAPALLARLPRPGQWMVVMKQLLAFPMFASAVWLLWVLGVQAGPDAMMQVLAGALLIAFALWLLNQSGNAIARLSALLLVFFAIYIGATQEARVSQSSVDSTEDGVGTYSIEALAIAKKKGPVFVNFTAAWCITCKVNELNALDVDIVKQAFKDNGITYLRGDWTNEDPGITAALQEYGRSGVPLYLLYAKDAPRATVLPQILTQGIVLDALEAL